MSGNRLGTATVLLVISVLITGVIYRCGKQEEIATIQEEKTPVRKPSPPLKEGEWENLSSDNLDGWIMKKPGAWKLENGVMTGSEGGGYIWTKERYGNFILDCEFKIGQGGNSGIFFRTADLKDPVQTGIEMQVYNTPRNPKPVKNDCGAIYDLLEPSAYADKPAGEWNHVTISCRDNLINVFMNGVHIINMDVDKWTTPRMNPDGTENKFNKALKDFPREGYIGFQDHGDPVWYRNVKIKSL